MADVKQTAGQLIFAAAADQDMGQVVDALRGFHPDGSMALILTLAETAAAALEAHRVVPSSVAAPLAGASVGSSYRRA